MTLVSPFPQESASYDERKEKYCCDKPNLLKRDGYYVCSNCGETHYRVLSDLPTKTFSLEDERNRRQTEKVYSPYGPRTVIKGTRDGNGNYLKAEDKAKFKRLAKINRGLINGYERNLWVSLPKFNKMQTQLNIPKYVSDDAFKIYTIAAKRKLTIGRSINGLLSAATYIALRAHGITRTMSEVLKVTDIDRKDLLKCFKVLHKEVLPELKLELKRFNAFDYINNFRERLGLSMECRNMAIKLIKQSYKKGLRPSGKDPKGIAAAGLYICAKLNDEHKTQKQICKIAKISEVTLRMRLKDIEKYTS
ncbi:MAG: hypothetical protein EU544_03605 [Promethearchaeota archaeon]|nr:MAG: hypothetical protein EU544_03605 [Candidatus Lokiarchaeota archaeon]